MPKIDAFFNKMLDMGASDLHLTSGAQPMVRVGGEMTPISSKAVTPQMVNELLMELISEAKQERFKKTRDLDFAHPFGEYRFRVNMFYQRKGVGAVFRVIPAKILTVEELGLPEQVLRLARFKKGLVLVTGATGSGKSTTLAALVDHINSSRKEHIITVEDPIEFVHENKMSLVDQREVGTHTQSFATALKAALREDPDIILVGEMRDLETIELAITAAETGHLVFGTLHTSSAPKTVDRIINVFPNDQQEQIRTMLSESLRGVVSQNLLKKAGGGRVAALEILITNSATNNLIREGKTFQLHSIIQTGKRDGMQTMDQAIMEHLMAKRVTAEEAMVYAVDKKQFESFQGQ